MKKFLILIFMAAIGFSAAKAELKIKPDSYFCLQDKNRDSGSDMGVQNMTFKALEDQWKADSDGDLTTALLVVFFENMSEEDMRDLRISSLSSKKSPEIIEDVVMTESRPSRRFFIPEWKKTFDINFAHTKLGPVRLTVPKMERKKVYYVTIQASGITPISIETNPVGATVILDGVKYPKTNITIPDIPFGTHTLALEFPLNSSGISMPETRIEVSPSQTTFAYDLLRSKEVSLLLSPSNAEVQIFNSENSVVAEGKGKVKVNLKYGTYKIKGRINNESMESNLIVDDTTPYEQEVAVKPSKTVTFRAMQNNQDVEAAIDIDGVRLGVTPLVHTLPYDHYYVSASYSGFTKTQGFKVSKNSGSDILIKIPNHKRSSWNPFDVDYEPYDWGVGATYINRCYRWTQKGFNNWYTDFFGQERRNHGAEINILYQHTYKYGQGFRTGLNIEMLFGEIEVDDGETAESQLHAEISMQIPLEYQFRLPISRHFSFFCHGGIGVNIGLLSQISLGEDEKINMGYGNNEDYGWILPRRCDCTWIIGGGLQFKHIQLEAKFERGLADNAKLLKKYGDADISGVSWRRQVWGVSFIYLFGDN